MLGPPKEHDGLIDGLVRLTMSSGYQASQALGTTRFTLEQSRWGMTLQEETIRALRSLLVTAKCCCSCSLWSASFSSTAAAHRWVTAAPATSTCYAMLASRDPLAATPG